MDRPDWTTHTQVDLTKKVWNSYHTTKMESLISALPDAAIFHETNLVAPQNVIFWKFGKNMFDFKESELSGL